MRFLLLIPTAIGSLLGDGCFSCSESNYAYDEVTTTVWRGKVLSVERNGTKVDTGTYKFGDFSNDAPHSLKGLDSMTIMSQSVDTSWSWSSLSIYGGGIGIGMVAVGP